MSRKSSPTAPVDVFIAQSEDKKAKGRAFAATLFAWVEADGLWDGGDSANEMRRPIAAWFGCSDGAVSAVRANLRLGRRCEVPDGSPGSKYGRIRQDRKGDRWEFLKGSPYRYDETRVPDAGGSMLEVKLPNLLRIDGDGMIAQEGAAFVVLPSRAWASAQRFDDGAIWRHLRAMTKVPEAVLVQHFPMLAATGALFAAYLDRRTRCPLPADPRLHAQIMVGAIAGGLAGIHTGWNGCHEQPWGHSEKIGLYEEGTARVGLLPGVALKADHARLEAFLAAEVQRYMRERR